MMFSLFKIMLPRTLIVLIASASVFSLPDYFWTSFDGSVPKNAVVGARNGDKYVYIGNVPIWNGGLYVGELYEGKKQIIVTGHPDNDHNGVWIRQDNIQILCSTSEEPFDWVPVVNRTTLNGIPYHLVRGGYQYEKNLPLYIGRAQYNGRYVVGKVSSYKEEPQYRNILYVYDEVYDNERTFADYEVLVHKGS